MDQVYRGRILQGSIDCETKELTVNCIANLTTQSVWGLDQITEMLHEVLNATQQNRESIVVTIRDSLSLILNRGEMNQIYYDIHEVYSKLTFHETSK